MCNTTLGFVVAYQGVVHLTAAGGAHMWYQFNEVVKE